MNAMKVQDVMTPEVITVGPGTSLSEVARLMADNAISGVPVMDPSGELIGVISEGDFLVKERGRPAERHRALDHLLGRTDDAEMRRFHAQTAAQAMTSPAVTIDADRTLREAAALMIDRAINRLPVMRDGHLVGIVSRADLVRAYAHRDEATLHTIRTEVIHDTMWIDPDTLQVEVKDGLVRLEGTVDRRSTATILAKLIGLVDGADQVENHLTWDFDDRRPGPPSTEREPGSASLTAREHARPIHG